jgi:hypothetical protein
MAKEEAKIGKLAVICGEQMRSKACLMRSGFGNGNGNGSGSER